MRGFLSQVLADFKQGIWKCYVKYMIVIVISMILANGFFTDMSLYIKKGLIDSRLSYGECVVYIFRGMKEFIPSPKNPFEVPTEFLLLNIFLAFIIGNYPMKNIHEFGMLTLIRSNNRLLWWLSKCLWNIASVITFYIMIYVGIAITYITHIGVTNDNIVQLNAKVIKYVLQTGNNQIDSKMLIISAIILPIATSIAISMLQMMLAFFIKPIVSYMVTVSIYIFSAYYMKWFMIGNYMMMYRNKSINENGMQIGKSLMIDIIIFTVSIITGYVYFKRYDVLSKD